MPKGVFNPYVKKKPKKKFQAPTDHKNPYDTEFGTPRLGNIKLDGDSYVLELQELDVANIAARLGELLDDSVKNHRSILLRHGIDLLPLQDTRALEQGEVSLPTPKGHLCVYVSEENLKDKSKTEVEVFRRIACAFREIPREILAKHKARVIVRT